MSADRDALPSRMCTRKDIVRKELVSGKRSDNRALSEFAATSISQLKCSNPEDVIVIARIGDTRVSCLLSLEIREAEPDPDLIHLKVTTADDAHQKAHHHDDDGDSDDEVEMDNHEDRSSANLEREATLETLIEEFDLIDESRLILLPGRLVLHLHVTINVLQNNGSVIDAGFLALVAALERLQLPTVQHDVTEDTFQFDWNQLHSAGGLLRQRCVCSTFAVTGHLLVCGPSAEEEDTADAVIVAVSGKEQSLAFIQVIDGQLPPGFTGLPYDRLVESAAARRLKLERILTDPASDDSFIPENKAVRLSSTDTAVKL
ncbi:hypothetical protein BV898_17666 [Hypsibius exemplaris]|uniref:Ribosomal RNA-processing protein 43 n=1 Tax=Hypsibius exemplaris TaxID=2072580 RepID=A0A9X6NMN3_HYPEX|nr:hypothetical protein BV898_17666 [Hypsibius exemplaris]